MGPFQRFGLLLLPHILSAAALDVSADTIAADDECQTAEGAAGLCALNALQVKGKATVEVEAEVEEATIRADTFPDLSTGFDIPGPYLEEPSEEEAEQPRQARAGWENETSLRQFDTWGQSFCTSHHTGYFCDQTTRVRCCHNTFGYVKCGSTVHDSHCGYGGGGGGYPGGGGYDSRRRYYDSRRRYIGGGGYPGGGGAPPWHIHAGWHTSSYCTSHHTGYFCTAHTKVHCCNDNGHYVDCTTHTSTSNRC